MRAVAALLAGVVVALAWRGRRASGERWLVVTVECDRVPATWPGPLGALGDRVEIRNRPTARGDGIELLARPVDGRVSRAELKAALQRAKELVEGVDGRVPPPRSDVDRPVGGREERR
ncbi:hypothetical protein [Actinosynnema pretiosum]|uniref:Uncharacterized protein n=1 Tax=Actinosynnema pretiosum TaxID=42197 RepID=A0A290Z6L8_9PSEU|nr:hypothetical protein [Actinosynnema pretiosum]ATE54625.1 hypothetical protein CNX65_16095 [Actinosynnema pretiosum]